MNRVEDIIAADFVQVFSSRLDHLKYAFTKAPEAGHALEFGVWQGKTLRALSTSFPERHFFGFDSFEGLPEKWVRSFDGTRKSDKGEFGIEKVPDLPCNVQLVIGWFSDIIKQWVAQNPETISFIHLDCDLYSSTTTVLDALNQQIKPGTVIALDEFCDWNEQGVYERWREGEALALVDWCSKNGRKVRPLARTNWIEGSVVVME